MRREHDGLWYPRGRRHSMRGVDVSQQLAGAQAAGMSPQEIWTTLREGLLAAARRGRWKPSETQRALGVYRRALVDAYGREATRFLRTSPKGD